MNYFSLVIYCIVVAYFQNSIILGRIFIIILVIVTMIDCYYLLISVKYNLTWNKHQSCGFKFCFSFYQFSDSCIQLAHLLMLLLRSRQKVTNVYICQTYKQTHWERSKHELEKQRNIIHLLVFVLTNDVICNRLKSYSVKQI